MFVGKDLLVNLGMNDGWNDFINAEKCFNKASRHAFMCFIFSSSTDYIEFVCSEESEEE